MRDLHGPALSCTTPEAGRRMGRSNSPAVRVVGPRQFLFPPAYRLGLPLPGTANRFRTPAPHPRLHRLDAANDEATGRLGGAEPDAPDTWRFSIEVATAWERAADEVVAPRTRKVLLRSAMTMSPCAFTGRG